MTDTKQRIGTLDGLRAVAAFGVLWIHTWTVNGNPRLVVAGLDITSLLAIGGNGVDLFFVISGFCMYYFYAHRATFNYSDFGSFMLKRWKRLSPAFYTASLVYLLLYNPLHNPVQRLFTSIFYVNSLSPYNIAGHFWSLGAEWQFYLVVPFILIYQIRRSYTWISGILVVVMATISLAGIILLKKDSDMLMNQIPVRYFEFLWGIIVARILLTTTFQLKFRLLWAMGFVVLIYGGRILLSAQILSLSDNYYNVFKLAGYTIMSCGFGGVMYLALTSKGTLQLLLGNRIVRSLGMVSFSFYLWHGLLVTPASNFAASLVPGADNLTRTFTAFVICGLMTTIVAFVSYRILEQPFLKTKKAAS